MANRLQRRHPPKPQLSEDMRRIVNEAVAEAVADAVSKVLKGNTALADNDSFVEPSRKWDEGGEPTDNARNSLDGGYVIVRATMPRNFWNQAPSIAAFLRHMYAIRFGAKGTDEEVIDFVQKFPQSDRQTSKGGLLHSWRWGESMEADVAAWLAGAGVRPPDGRKKYPSAANSFGVAFWEAKCHGVSTSVIINSLEGQQLQEFVVSLLKLWDVSKDQGKYIVTNSLIGWWRGRGNK